MTRRVTIYRVRIVTIRGDMMALLDMLRYEGARVAAWDHEPGPRETFIVTIASEQYVPERWASFGITPEVAS